MKKVYHVPQINEGMCIGDRVCENACPSGAITMQDKKARVEETLLPKWLKQRGIDPQTV